VVEKQSSLGLHHEETTVVKEEFQGKASLMLEKGCASDRTETKQSSKAKQSSKVHRSLECSDINELITFSW